MLRSQSLLSDVGFIGSHATYYTTWTLPRIVALTCTLNNIVAYLGDPENVSLFFFPMKCMLDFFGQVSLTVLECDNDEKFPLETLNVL